ncbi:MAG TPA: hypothetical protein VGG54_01025 [Trebonia sp.]|jgi:hypothetical protein
MTGETTDAGQEAVDPLQLDQPNLTADELSAFKEGFETDPTEVAYQWAYMEVALAFMAGNFCAAFFQALGRRAADAAANLPKRATDLLRRRLRRDGQPDEYHIGLKDGVTATIVVTEDTPDEARLALLDLDVTASELRGKELRWDEATGAWRPSGALPAESDEARQPG